VRFCTSTPLRRTSSGNRGSASCTRLLTLKTAVSTFVPTSNVAVIDNVPFDADDELKYSMPSTPESCSSIGAATVCARVSALAPGYVALIWIVGGTISGYWAIGRRMNAAMPASTMMIALTPANTGRRRK
jgi:hypothetical protein